MGYGRLGEVDQLVDLRAEETGSFLLDLLEDGEAIGVAEGLGDAFESFICHVVYKDTLIYRNISMFLLGEASRDVLVIAREYVFDHSVKFTILQLS